MPVLSQEAREKFLAEPHYGSLSVHEGASRGPLTVPIWYQYTPGGEAWILSFAGTRKAQAIKAAGRFSLMVQTPDPMRRYVAIEGPVVRTETVSDEDLVELVYRYLDGGPAERHLAVLRSHNSSENLKISMRPERWLSSDKGAF